MRKYRKLKKQPIRSRNMDFFRSKIEKMKRKIHYLEDEIDFIYKEMAGESI